MMQSGEDVLPPAIGESSNQRDLKEKKKKTKKFEMIRYERVNKQQVENLK